MAKELITLYLRNNCTYKLWVSSKKGKTFELTHQGVSLKPHPDYMNCFSVSVKMDQTYFENAMYLGGIKDIAKAVPTILQENGMQEVTGLKITNAKVIDHENFTYLTGIGSKII